MATERRHSSSRRRPRRKWETRRSRTPDHRRTGRRHIHRDYRRCRSFSHGSRDSLDSRTQHSSRAVTLVPNRRRRRRRQRRKYCSPYSPARSASRPRKTRSVSRTKHVQRSASASSGSRESIRWEPGLRLGLKDQYTFERQLGKGAFSRVMGCRDVSTNSMVAIKVAKDNPRQRRHAESEAAILKRLSEAGGTKHSCPRLLDAFVLADRHFCLVFEPLALSLHDLLQYSGEQGLLVADTKEVARQLLHCLCFVHSLGLAHTDIKCQNVMLRDGDFDLVPHPRASQPWQAPQLLETFHVVLIDFGCAVAPETHRKGRVGARQIRAPEVIMELDWNTQADLWSLGCVMAALYTGSRLFQVHDDMEHLAVIERKLGAVIPLSMSSRASERVLRKGVAFEPDGRLAWPACAASEEAAERVLEMRPLSEIVHERHSSFLKMLLGLLEIQPHLRLNAEAALKTEFLTSDHICE